ncbi:Rv1733c family protein [Saccharopolyspora phatthalungensis]|uniref:Transmembrane protein n=1 Tax=Saccharopolyspora phatthalungensis TaxID=664693 RepID=A0A840QC84_9PSEU|nr:hypothetical protein [Saccharopolyspora phatthalungensis]MBB5156055.1 hypothetical protein [Saccharopolyspora phatthalungensis]
MEGSLRNNLRWLVHALRSTPNSLRRPADRVAAAIMAVLLAAALIGIPVAVWAGFAVHARESAEAAVAVTVTRSVAAVVVEPPQTRFSGENREVQTVTWWSKVQWLGMDGLPRVDTARVPPSTEVGGTVPLWVDSADRITEAPDSDVEVLVGAVTSAVMVLIAWQAVCLGLLFLTRVTADSLATRAWHREWEIVEPKWTRQER